MATTKKLAPSKVGGKSALQKSIDGFKTAAGAERNLYHSLKQMLCNSAFGVSAEQSAIVIDSPIPGTRSTPDLAIYLIDPQSGKPIVSASHVFASIEVKPGDRVLAEEAAIFQDKSKYITSTTRFFYLVDQEHLAQIPMPQTLTDKQLSGLELISKNLLNSDNELAQSDSAVANILKNSKCESISRQIARGLPTMDGVVLPNTDAPLPDKVQITSSGLVDELGELVMQIPDDDLKVVVAYMFERIDSDDGEDLMASEIANLKIPTDQLTIAQVAKVIRDLANNQAQVNFDNRRKDLDEYAAQLLSLTPSDLDFIRHRMSTDGFLSQLRPMWAHRGLHMQSYKDHSGGDRFTR